MFTWIHRRRIMSGKLAYNTRKTCCSYYPTRFNLYIAVNGYDWNSPTKVWNDLRTETWWKNLLKFTVVAINSAAKIWSLGRSTKLCKWFKETGTNFVSFWPQKNYARHGIRWVIVALTDRFHVWYCFLMPCMVSKSWHTLYPTAAQSLSQIWLNEFSSKNCWKLQLTLLELQLRFSTLGKWSQVSIPSGLGLIWCQKTTILGKKYTVSPTQLQETRLNLIGSRWIILSTSRYSENC